MTTVVWQQFSFSVRNRRKSKAREADGVEGTNSITSVRVRIRLLRRMSGVEASIRIARQPGAI
jgi:hypothetical protein